MNTKRRLGELLQRWPVLVLAAGAALTVVWIGALFWIFVELLAGFSRI